MTVRPQLRKERNGVRVNDNSHCCGCGTDPSSCSRREGVVGGAISTPSVVTGRSIIAMSACSDHFRVERYATSLSMSSSESPRFGIPRYLPLVDESCVGSAYIGFIAGALRNQRRRSV